RLDRGGAKRAGCRAHHELGRSDDALRRRARNHLRADRLPAPRDARIALTAPSRPRFPLMVRGPETTGQPSPAAPSVSSGGVMRDVLLADGADVRRPVALEGFAGPLALPAVFDVDRHEDAPAADLGLVL